MSSAPKFILVTRPQPEADKLCVLLDNQGIKAIAAPLITIEYPSCPLIEYQNVQALIATSKNGLRALMRSQYKNFFLKRPLFVVGPSTALLAKTLGFTNVYEGRGTAQDLLPLITQHCHPSKGTLFHLAGSVLAFDLQPPLQAKGFTVIAPVIYHARAEKTLPEKVKIQLAMHQIDRVVLMSPRIAQIFTAVLEQEALSYLAKDLQFYCLSQNVATALKAGIPSVDLNITMPQSPNQKMLLALIADSMK